MFFLTYALKYTRINKTLLLFCSVAIGAVAFYIIFFKYGIFNEVRHSDGLVSSLMSYRDELLMERTLPFINEHWNIYNYLFGGVSDIATKSQMELFDIFFFFGIVGGIIYLYIYLKAFLTFKPTLAVKYMLLALFMFVLLAGNFFFYPSIAIYLVILAEYLKSNETNKYT